MSKYLDSGAADGLDQAEAAFARALELNPDLPLTHKLLAQVEVDRGRARDAMARLIERARLADPELLSGLVATCRYCGLLDASVGAYGRAIALEPKVRTSIAHTWFLQGDYLRVATLKPATYPYIVPLSLAEVGRKAEALVALRDLEAKIPTRIRHLVGAARLLLEGKAAESATAMLATDIQDPEVFFYAARHLARVGEPDAAMGFLDRSIAGGFFCYPAMAKDTWLDSLRKKPACTKLLKRAEMRHLEAATTFGQLNGERMLGLK
jgi:tetratricopeptide (TPR) repeat protein